ncbi:MAG: glycosyltransferase [Candidatus Marinimicrobia bacterium]|nr:glycosyltransferase [Candidatus Neomarinimicrobiota bacterium]
MQVSGFSFVRNAIKLGYPVVEALRSILPICDELVIAVGRSEDNTFELIKSIGDKKIKIIETEWDKKDFVRGKVYSIQTDIALEECQGDWCFYIQADEVVHEKYLPVVLSRMKELIDDDEVQGLLFDYLHFWGSYDYYQRSRRWYRREIRVIRNNIGVQGWLDAQGFRINGRKLKVAKVDAYVYHYGWVRPPDVMTDKNIVFDTIHHSREWVENKYKDAPSTFNYGDPKYLAKFSDSHPKVMGDRIAEYNWDFSGGEKAGHAHERLIDRIRSFVEDRVLHYRVGEYKNYILLKNR